jgi:hypothetical protein
MNEPDNHTAWIDRLEGTWVRVDEYPHPGNGGTWYPLTDGPGFDEWARTGVGTARPWDWTDEYGPFTAADSERTAMALARVREWVTRA